MDVLGLILSIVFAALVAAVVIWIVGRLGLGMEVSGFGPAFIAAIVIAIVGGVVLWLLGLLGVSTAGGWWGALVNLVVAAIVLMISGNLVKGLKVNGFIGAIVAAIAIGVVTWIITWLLGLFL